MQIRNHAQGYGVVSRSIHWLTAGLLLAAFLLGELLEDVDEECGAVGWVFDLHSGIGLIVLGLVLLRLLWIPLGGRVPELGGVDWQLMLARIVRAALWLCMLGLPLSGWAMVNAEGHALSFFGMFALPQLVSPGSGIGELAEEIHEALPGVLMFAVALHVAGALKHHFIDGDRTLLRMWRDSAQ